MSIACYNSTGESQDLLLITPEAVMCANASAATSISDENVRSFDAFLYILIVLSFYAVSMTLLMVKYIRREEEEMAYEFYYDEFVKREHFSNPSSDIAFKRMIEARIKSLEERKSLSLNVESSTHDVIVKVGDPVVTSSTENATRRPDAALERITVLPTNAVGIDGQSYLVETFV